MGPTRTQTPRGRDMTLSVRRFRPADAAATREVFAEAVLVGAAPRYSEAERRDCGGAPESSSAHRAAARASTGAAIGSSCPHDASAIPAPIPLLPPTTSATLPAMPKSISPPTSVPTGRPSP